MTTERYILAKLELDTALHIGTGKAGDVTDSPLRCAGDGRLVLPGRALGGALRTIATRLAPRLGLGVCKALHEHPDEKPCRCIVCELFGELYPDEHDEKKQGGAASLLWISDAFAEIPHPQTHVRDGVGLARATRTAARNVKYDFEIVPRGTVFHLRLRLVDDDAAEGAAERATLLAAALAEWQAGHGRLGGSAARGLGRFTLKELKCVRSVVETKEQLMAYLQAPEPWTLGVPNDAWLDSALKSAQQAVVPFKDEAIPARRSLVTIAFQVAIDGPFLITDPLIGALAGFDHAPLLEVAFDQAGAPVLSGSSLRGALRTRAEKIARTLATLKWKERAEFLEHCPACDPLIGQPGAPLASCDRRLTIPDEEEVPQEALCLACRLFGSPRRGSRLWVEDAPWAGAALDADAWHAQDFLAIDRFTGGGQEGAKFDAAPLTQARFSVRLTLHDPKDWELGWLILVLRDLAEGEMTLGFGAAKGYGRATASAFEWIVGYLTPDDFPGDSALLVDARPSGIYHLTQTSRTDTVVPATWLKQAEEWVKKFNDAVEGFQPGDDWQAFKDDTFFDAANRIVELYGLPRTEEVKP